MYMYRPHTFFDVATSKFPGTRLKVKNLASYPQVLRNNLNFLRPKISLFLKKGAKIRILNPLIDFMEQEKYF